jgi:glycosyltransferase involved in cell wall biosynthesis
MIPFDLDQRRRYPLGYQRTRNWLLQRLLLAGLKRADLVIFISDHARRVFERAANGPLRRWVLIPHGVGPRFRTAGRTDLARSRWLPAEGYLLYVSTLDYYKAQLEVVQGYALLRKRGLHEKLLLVGAENPSYGRRVRNEVAKLGLQDDVIIAGALPYDEMPALYHHAALNIFASESENCPNVLLEALGAGRPILCSNRPPMPEFGGDAVAYFDPASPQEFADCAQALRADPQRGAALATRAVQRSLLYDWGNTASMTWEALGSAGEADTRR